MQPAAILTTDTRWYHIDVYEQRGQKLVKVAKKTFRAAPDDAHASLLQITGQNATRSVKGYVWSQATMRWQPWSV